MTFAYSTNGGRKVAVGGSTPIAPRRRRRTSGLLTSYALVLPAMALFAFVWLVPLVRAILLSGQRSFADGTTRNVGLQNFRDLLSDEVARASFVNTGLLIVLIAIPMAVVSFALALLLERGGKRFTTFVGPLILLPFVTSAAVVAIVFRSLFQETGEINGLLKAAGLTPIGWLTEPWPARLAIASMVLWAGLGFSTMLMLAGLGRIPGELYDAAKVDGASAWQTIKSITLPQMNSVFLFVTVTTSFGVFNLFAEPKLLTTGGPGSATTTPGLLAYQQAFLYARFGSGAAIGLSAGVLAVVFGVLQLRLGRDRS